MQVRAGAAPFGGARRGEARGLTAPRRAASGPDTAADCLYEIICSLPLLEELDGHDVSDAMRRRAHAELGLEYDPADAGAQAPSPPRSPLPGADAGGDGDARPGAAAEGSDGAGGSTRRLSAAGAALRKVAFQEEIDIFTSAADLARKMGAPAPGGAEGGAGPQDRREGWQGDLVANAVADAEIGVQETAKRIIHASKMRAEEYKQLDAEVATIITDVTEGTG